MAKPVLVMLAEVAGPPLHRHAVYLPGLRPVLGSLPATILVCWLFERSVGTTTAPTDLDEWVRTGIWVRATEQEIADETSLDPGEQREAWAQLERRGVVMAQWMGTPFRLHHSVNMDAFRAIVLAHVGPGAESR
jgi:hypothetical protein